MLNTLSTSKQAAEFLSCSKHTLDNSRSTGKLMGLPAPAHIKFGYAVRYKKETLEAWIDSLNEHVTNGEAA
jgi:hypothetical protein